jgi:hypothetical protein
MHHVFAMQQRLHREQAQNGKRHHADLAVAQRAPSQHAKDQINGECHRKTIHNSNLWCTGEDSNLRSSQGAADLQSAAINHSATCAESRSLPSDLTGNHSLRRSRPLRPHIERKNQNSCETYFRTRSLHVGRFLYGVLLDNLLRCRRPTCVRDFRKRFLELAKGFEPPTL